MKIATVFDQAAQDYDAARRRYISCFDDFYGVAIEQIPFQPDDHFSVLDLGAGTGLFSSLVRQRFPNCEMTLSDISSEMLNKAKERFHGAASVRFILSDYIHEPVAGQYDVIISGLSLHHSTESELQAVFKKLYGCLTSNGIFINADQILGRTPAIEKAYEAAWLRQAQRQCSEAEIEVALERMASDKTLPLTTQLTLLESAGFKQVNCWYQYYRYAVYTGMKLV